MTPLAAETAENQQAIQAFLNHSFLAAAACLAPTEKNSVMTSRGMPFVSGTFKKTKTQEMAHTTAYMAKIPVRPIELSITGSV